MNRRGFLGGVASFLGLAPAVCALRPSPLPKLRTGGIVNGGPFLVGNGGPLCSAPSHRTTSWIEDEIVARVTRSLGVPNGGDVTIMWPMGNDVRVRDLVVRNVTDRKQVENAVRLAIAGPDGNKIIAAMLQDRR